MKQRSGFYMMGTRAIAGRNDISRDAPDLCVIYGKKRGYYIGNWVTGLGFVGVRFPIATTRRLASAERRYYHNRWFNLNGCSFYQFKTGIRSRGEHLVKAEATP